MNRNTFIKEINRIFRVALIQKTIHMILRAAWIGGAVYLLFWGTNRLWGWFPNQGNWGLFALLVALLMVGSVFLVSQPSKKFVWRLDRGYSLREQVYTLFEILQTSGSDAEKQPGVKELIGSEAIADLPKVRREVVDKGWRVKEEFEASVVVLILLMIVYTTSVNSMVQIPSDGAIGILPALGSDPSAEQVFAGGIPGNRGTGEGGGIDAGGIDGGGLPGPLDLSPLEWTQINTSMRNLGERLSQEAGTYDLGMALVEENYKEAANQFGNLAENAVELTPEVQTRIASHFLDTAVGLQNLQQRRISSYFQEASAALFEGSSAQVSEEMDDLAGLMDLFSQYQAQEMRADLNFDPFGSVQQPLDQFQNNFIIIEEVDDLPDYVSSLNGSEAEGGESLGESLDFIMPFDGNVIEGTWLPFQYSLEDSDVVSSYFSPR